MFLNRSYAEHGRYAVLASVVFIVYMLVYCSYRLFLVSSVKFYAVHGGRIKIKVLRKGRISVRKYVQNKKNWTVCMLLVSVVTSTYVTHEMSRAPDRLCEGECGEKFGVIMEVDLSVRT